MSLHLPVRRGTRPAEWHSSRARTREAQPGGEGTREGEEKGECGEVGGGAKAWREGGLTGLLPLDEVLQRSEASPD